LLRDAPAQAKRRECAPLMAGCQIRGTITTNREARDVLVGVVVIQLRKQRQQRALASTAGNRLGARVAESVLDVARSRVDVQQIPDATADEVIPGRVGLLAD